jgi:hypothetical protein
LHYPTKTYAGQSTDAIQKAKLKPILATVAPAAKELTLHRPLHAQQLEFGYVPFQYSDSAPCTIPAEDRARAERLFDEIRQKQTDGRPSVTFLVGSCRINLLVEKLVASVFSCRPFDPPDRKWPVPFYLLYRPHDPDLPSCFGGRKPPPSCARPALPGIYYRSGNQHWTCCPNSEGGDTGVVIVTFQEASQALEVALFGFSSASTAAVGNYFLKHADEFWPPNAELTGRQVAVYICQFTWTTTAAEPTCSVVLLPKEILNPPPPPHDSWPDATRLSTAGAKTRKA